MNEIFVKLVNMSVAAGWLILAVLVLRLLLKRAPRWITCLLWALVAVRLVCPVSLPSPVSVYQVATPAAVQETGQVEYFQYVHAGGDKPSIQLDVEAIRPVDITGEPAADAAPAGDGTARGTVTRYLPPFVAVWLAVGSALLLYGLVSTLHLRRRVGEAMYLRYNIWVCDAVTSPFLLGLFRPRIYLPSGMDEGQMAYVIAHENAHLQRLDQLWKPLGYVLLAIHWFNPLVWLAYVLFCRDIETACDQRVVRGMDAGEKKAYSAALLDCSQGRRMVLACPVAFGEEGVKGRIKAVLRYKKPALWVVLAALLICAAVAVCFLTDPMGGGKKGTLTFVEKEAVVSTYRADFTVDTEDAALDAALYADVWRDGQCETTQLLTMNRHVRELSLQLQQPERNQQMLPQFTLWAATDAYGGYGSLSDGLPQLPQDTAFAAYGNGETRQVKAGDDVVLMAVAADLGGGLPEFDCRTLEKQPRLPESADYMIVVRAAFAAAEETSGEDVLGKDTDSAHEYLLPTFRLPVEVDIDGVEDTGSVQSLDMLINDHRWVMPVTVQPTGTAPSITLHAASGDTLYAERGMDALLWDSAEGMSTGYAGDMTGDEIIDALSGWAWQMKRNIARSKEAMPDADTFFQRFPDGGFRWDIYSRGGSDPMVLLGLLSDRAQSGGLTAAQCRALLLSTDGLDGAYTEGYIAVLTAAYQSSESAYMEAWRGLTNTQQQASLRDQEGILPQPTGAIRWSYDSSALSGPYMTVNGSGRVFYMEVPDDLVTRIRQRAAEHVTLGGFEPPADTHGWLRPLNSWTAERPEVHLIFTEDSPRETYSLLRGDGGVWGIGTESGAVQADAEVRELLSLIASLTGWQTTMGRERFSDLLSAELIYNGETLHTVTDAGKLAQLQNLLQGGTQCSYAAKTPPECVQLRLTRSNGTVFSVLVAPDTPRVYLPPFYYYEYNDYESTGTQPLLDALGLSAWPSAVSSQDGGAWLTALEAQLTPMPQGQSSGGASLIFPLSQQAVDDTLAAVGLPVRVAAEETQSNGEGNVSYTLRSGGEDQYPFGAVSSAVYDGGKRFLSVTYMTRPGEDVTFRWADWQRPIALANTLWGGFSDDGQLYRQLSVLEVPDDSDLYYGASWGTEVSGGYCSVNYRITTIQGKPDHVIFGMNFYESELEYRQQQKDVMQQYETLRQQMQQTETGE